MTDCVYIYKFDGGIFVKPQYDKQINTTVSFSDDGNLIITDVPEELENVTVSVSFKEGRTTTYLAQNTEIVNGRVKLDSVPDESLTYTVTITSGNYADITLAAAVGQIDTSVTASQREQLMDLIAKADELMSGSAKDNSVLASHRDEAAELLKDENATSDQAADLIAELSELIAKA